MTSRKAAGRQVNELADRFQDELLALELDAFAEMTRNLAINTTGIAASELSLRQTVRGSFTRTPAIMEQMFETGVDMAIKSIKAELQICESVISMRYEGIAERSTAAADGERQVIIQSAQEQFMAEFDYALGALVVAAQEQIRLNHLYDNDDPELLRRRLFHTGQVGLHGARGRGVWWWTVSRLQAVARALLISHVNSVRQTAMLAFRSE